MFKVLNKSRIRYSSNLQILRFKKRKKHKLYVQTVKIKTRNVFLKNKRIKNSNYNKPQRIKLKLRWNMIKKMRKKYNKSLKNWLNNKVFRKVLLNKIRIWIIVLVATMLTKNKNNHLQIKIWNWLKNRVRTIKSREENNFPLWLFYKRNENLIIN